MDRISQIKEFLKKNPNDSFLQHALALEYMKIDRDAEARELFESLLAREPSYTGSYYHLAKLLEKMGEKELAIGWYEKGMEAARAAGEQKALNELRSAYEELVY